MAWRRNRDGNDLEKAGLLVFFIAILWLYSKGSRPFLLLGATGVLVLVGLLVLIVFLVRKKRRRISADFEPEFRSSYRAARRQDAVQPSGMRNKTSDALINSPHSNASKLEYRFSMTLLYELEWKRFEQLVEGYFARTGWKTRPAPIGADGGVDIHLSHINEVETAAIVQCKAWAANHKVSVNLVRELYGVMASTGVPEGYFVTSGDYTGEAIDFAAGKRLTLIHGNDLLRRIESLPEIDKVNLYTLATAGDYTTPTCPSCGRKMVTRIAAKGRSVGNSFWGCPGFPRCQAKLTQRNNQ